MPQIKQYEAPENLGLRPTETGITATAAAARRVGSQFSEAAAAQQATGARIGSAINIAGDIATKYLDHQQISQGAPAFAGLMAAKEMEWNKINNTADPNDPTVAPKFMEGVEADLEKFKSGFLTERAQQWAEARVDAFRTHLTRTTAADMSRKAGEAEIINQRQEMNSLSVAVRNTPSSLQLALDTLEDSHNARIGTSNIEPQHAGALARHLQTNKEALVRSAALGHIEKTGEIPEWVTDGKYSKYVNANELKDFQKNAEHFQRLQRMELKSMREEAERLQRTDFNTKLLDLKATTMPQNVGDRPTLQPDSWQKLRDLSTHPGAAHDPERITRTMAQFDAITNRLNKAEPLARTSNLTEIALIRRFRATDDSRLEPGKDAEKIVWEEYDKGNLTSSGLRRMLNEANLLTPEDRALKRDRDEFFKRHSLAIDPSLGASSEGQQKQYFAEMDARRQEAVLRKQNKDPALVYDPRSEHYFGRPENLGRFKASLTDLMRGLRDETIRAGPATVIPNIGDRKQFKQGWGVWDGKTYVPETK